MIGYQPDGNRGTLARPLELTFSKIPLQGAFHVEVHPNPFIDHTTIDIWPGTRDGAEHLQLGIAIYDMSGHLVANEAGFYPNHGRYSFTWDGRSGKGGSCPPGVYLIKVSLGERVKTYKVMKLR